jgi:ATP-dependent Clp protease ATP-binding subunit ClpC
MSEFLENHSVSKLIGSPPGYVGYEEGGSLTEKVRRHPYSVLLFDEIEKASHEVLNLLLQIMDEGTLTDSLSRSVDFKNTYIILTSNLGQEAYDSRSAGFIEDKDESYGKVKEILKNKLKPEFLGRIDEIIPFSSLDIDDLNKIAVLCLEDLKKRLIYEGIEFEYDNNITKMIAKESIQLGIGARGVKQIISSNIEGSLSRLIVTDGKSSFLAYMDNGKINVKNINKATLTT